MFVFHLVRILKGIIFAPFLRYNVVAVRYKDLIITRIAAVFIAVKDYNENHILNFKD